MIMRHVRNGNENVMDHRHRSKSRYPNKLRPTVCGAEPTMDDVTRDHAQHVISKFSVLKPEWVADLCPDCRRLLP